MGAEAHITCLVKDAAAATLVAQRMGWSTSQIARDPILGQDTYFYLTAHSDQVHEIMAHMHATSEELGAAHVWVVREKVELVVFDVRYGLPPAHEHPAPTNAGAGA